MTEVSRQEIANDPVLRCPKCLVKLDQIEFYQIPIEKCPECNGIWLDAGELELIHERERMKDSWLAKLFKRLAKDKSAADTPETTSPEINTPPAAST